MTDDDGDNDDDDGDNNNNNNGDDDSDDGNGDDNEMSRMNENEIDEKPKLLILGIEIFGIDRILGNDNQHNAPTCLRPCKANCSYSYRSEEVPVCFSQSRRNRLSNFSGNPTEVIPSTFSCRFW